MEEHWQRLAEAQRIRQEVETEFQHALLEAKRLEREIETELLLALARVRYARAEHDRLRGARDGSRVAGGC